MSRPTHIPSRYDKATLISDAGQLYLGIRPQTASEPRPTDVFYTVRADDTLQRVAARHLGDPRLWWVIADFNDIIDPFADLVVNSTLRLPSAQRLWTEVLI